MRPDRFTTHHTGQTSRRDPPPTPLGSILLAAVFVALPFAASYPVASGIAVAAVLAGRRAAPAAAERLRALRDADGVGPICIPGTDVCLGA